MTVSRKANQSALKENEMTDKDKMREELPDSYYEPAIAKRPLPKESITAELATLRAEQAATASSSKELEAAKQRAQEAEAAETIAYHWNSQLKAEKEALEKKLQTMAADNLSILAEKNAELAASFQLGKQAGRAETYPAGYKLVPLDIGPHVLFREHFRRVCGLSFGATKTLWRELIQVAPTHE